jgi:uncharacterized membrane protein (DUF4010 family)
MQIKNPFELGMAIKMAIFLTIILVLSQLAKEWLGDAGLYALSAVSGLADVDAISLSMARMARDPNQWQVAKTSILIASMVNTVVKGGFTTWLCGQQLAWRSWMVLGASIAAGGILLAVL